MTNPTFQEQVNRLIKEEYARYQIKENLADYGGVEKAYISLAPPNLQYHYFDNNNEIPFVAGANQFELSNAWWLMQSALLAYADSPFATPIFNNVGFNVGFIENKTTSTQCYVVENNDFAIVVFRGTQIKTGGHTSKDIVLDILTDGNLNMVNAPIPGHIHNGFKESFESIWGDLQPVLNKLGREGKKIWFTGHSLGAALATLAASYYKGAIQGLYTFGSPRVGDGTFCNALKAKLSTTDVYRFVHRDDIVTKAPIIDPELRIYEPIGKVKYLNDGNVIQDDPNVLRQLEDNLTAAAQNILSGANRLIFGSLLTNWKASAFSELLMTMAPTGIPNHAPIYYAIILWANYQAAK